jgi:hypothetical protein
MNTRSILSVMSKLALFAARRQPPDARKFFLDHALHH